jgi:RNA polymerase sigma factor (sigma-70 family)
MSYEIAGRISWLVSWIDHWRGHAYATDTVRNITKRGQSRAWTHWLRNVAHNVSSDCASADDALISQTLAARHLRESVEHLPSNERQVLLLHVNNGLTYWEIAARLGLEEEVVLRDLAHAYSQLRLELSADDLRR